jgi:hypothetical protein
MRRIVRNDPKTSLDYAVEASVEPTAWLVSLQYGDGIVIQAETKELARAKANQLGVGIYTSPIAKIDKIEVSL